MIRSVWFKIFGIMLLVTGPLLGAHYILQRQGVSLAFTLADRVVPRASFEQHQSALKKLAQLDPTNEERYRTEFQSVVEARSLADDLGLMQSELTRDLARQTLRNALLVALGALALSFLIARNIATGYARLLDEKRRSVEKLAKVASLENWQTGARMLVHELKGPLTPIRLVAGDLEAKQASLPPERFAEQLREGARLIMGQIKMLDTMLEGFTRFAKLPEPRFSGIEIRSQVESWIELFRKTHGPTAKFTFDVGVLTQTTIQADASLLQALVTNLVNNALEANLGQAPRITLRLEQSVTATFLRVTNSGQPIPDNIAQRLFEPYVSTKRDTHKSNMGLGLAIAKKIALDHGGDLALAANHPDNVSFVAEIPFRLKGSSA